MIRDYVIKKGRHDSGSHFALYYGQSKVAYEWELTDSAIHFYPLGDENANDTHKVAGESFGNHMMDSVRTGFQNNNKQKRTNLINYMHNGGVTTYKRVGTVRTRTRYLTTREHLFDQNKFILTTIEKNTGISVLEEHGTGIIVPSLTIDFKYPSIRAGFRLWPYWGGQHTAPHNVTIKLGYL